MKTIIFATHNEHKVQEVREMLTPLNVEVISGNDCKLPDVEETGTTFEENALIKALAGVKELKQPVLSEDAGICIEGLDNAPGIFSARFAQAHGGFPAVFDYINQELKDNPNRKAHYVSTMVLAFSETEYYVFTGYMYGTLTKEAVGTGGFGYDPIFVPDGYKDTLGVLSADIKNSISHRHNALKQVYDFLEKHPDKSF